MGEVFVVGSLHLDVVVDAPHMPATDETVMGHAVAYRFGGKGGNQAVAAARMGAETSMAGLVGDDRFGDQILAALDASGVNRRQVRAVPGASGMSVAIVDAGGDYGAVVVSGVNQGISAKDIELPAGASVLLLQNEIPESVNVAIAARARSEIRVVLNAAPARAMDAGLLSRTDILVVNRKEAADMTGRPDGVPDPERTVKDLLGLGPRAAILTLGAGGLVGVSANGERFALSAHNVTTISTHGAGDAFVGALAAELARGESLRGAAGFANGAAALAVCTPPDARAGLTRAHVLTFLNEGQRP